MLETVWYWAKGIIVVACLAFSYGVLLWEFAQWLKKEYKKWKRKK